MKIFTLVVAVCLLIVIGDLLLEIVDVAPLHIAPAVTGSVHLWSQLLAPI